jgi:hypothetical protein
VTLNDDETIIVVADGEVWVMEVGSDNDAFIFHCGTRAVTVPFSNDYLACLT